MSKTINKPLIIQSIILLCFSIIGCFEGLFLRNNYSTFISIAALLPISLVIFKGRAKLFNRYRILGIKSPLNYLLHYGTCGCYFFQSTFGLIITLGNIQLQTFNYYLFNLVLIFSMLYFLSISLQIAGFMDDKTFE